MSRKKKGAISTTSEIVAVVSDIHFDLHDVPTWRAFKKWCATVRPSKIVFLGDVVDLGMISSYRGHKDDPINAIGQIKVAVKEINNLYKYTNEIIYMEGNHEARWDKIIVPTIPQSLAGAEGLSLKDQFYAQGLDEEVVWLREDLLTRGVDCGPFVLRHGHNQCRGFGGGGKYIAGNKIDKNMGQSESFGHHHKAQLYCKTALGRTAVAVANPCMTVNHHYDIDPNWQRGFTSLELYGHNNKYATPYIHLINDGHFAYGGKVFDGN